MKNNLKNFLCMEEIDCYHLVSLHHAIVKTVKFMQQAAFKTINAIVKLRAVRLATILLQVWSIPVLHVPPISPIVLVVPFSMVAPTSHAQSAVLAILSSTMSV